MDIDIDFPTDFDPLDYFETAVRASQVHKGIISKHNAGAYFQNIAKDKMTGLASIPYDEAGDYGYFKIDFLHLSVLDYFGSKEEIRKLIKVEPDWMLLESAKVVQNLFQLSRHYEIVSKIKPSSVQELADAIALVRPGKRYLLDAYVKNKEAIRAEIYKKPEDGKYFFKKGHAISYALTIVLQLHLIKGGIIKLI